MEGQINLGYLCQDTDKQNSLANVKEIFGTQHIVLYMRGESKISWSLEAVRFGLDFSNRSVIWQAPLQQRCLDSCQFSERYDPHNTHSRGYETSRFGHIFLLSE